jgi:ribose transport system permease protein
MADLRSNPCWIWFERLGPLVMLLALVSGFAVADWEVFISLPNLRMILVHTAILATCTLGMTMIMVSGGLDLSVGSVLALASVSGAATYVATGSGLMAGFAGVVAGVASGSVNGLLIAGFRMNPFIVTLGMMGMARGMARLVAEDSRIHLYHQASPGAEKVAWSPNLLEPNPSAEPWASLGLSPGILITVLLIVVMLVVMRRTIFGRHIYAIGSSEDAARLCGVRVGLTKYLIYALAGLIFGIAGLMQLSYDMAGDPTARVGFELKVIAAVVIGGASLAGGVGTILGSVVGALIMVVLTTGFNLVGVQAAMQELVIGLIIIAAVALDMFRQGRLRLPWQR